MLYDERHRLHNTGFMIQDTRCIVQCAATATMSPVDIKMTDHDGLEISKYINFDSDEDVDRDDLTILVGYRNQPASNCYECDIDSNGMITVLDARKLMLLCTRPRCATQ